MRALILIFAVVLLAGCQSLGGYDQDSVHYYRVPPGSRLTLHQPLTIPAGRVQARLQHGRVVGPAVNKMEPYCTLEVLTLREQSRVVRPDTFQITKVRAGQSLWGGSGRGPVVVASFGDEGLPVHVFYENTLFLASQEQPDVFKLSCRADRMYAGNLAMHPHISVRDIREALGAVFTLELRERE